MDGTRRDVNNSSGIEVGTTRENDDAVEAEARLEMIVSALEAMTKAMEVQ